MPKAGQRGAWLERYGLGRPELRAWAMYDWANSAFWTTIIAAVFPIYFSNTAAAELEPALATSRLALATALAIGLAALVSPFLGAMADYAAIKKRLLGLSLALGASASAALWFVSEGDWRLGLVLFVLGNFGAAASMTFYDSFLPHIAREDEVDRTSSSAYALGYLGGGVLLVINLVWISKPDWFGFSGAGSAARWSFVSAAVWWAVFSIPLFRRVPEPPADSEHAGIGLSLITVSVSRIATTFRELRQYKQALWLLIAFAVYNDGINTIIRMAGIFGAEVGLPIESLLPVFVLVQVAGVPFAFMFGRLAVRYGPKRSILGSLVVYAGISLFGYFVRDLWHFYVLALLVAMVQGGSQALSRSLFSTMVPKHRSSEFFGFFGIFEKFAGVLGPLVFGIVAERTRSSRPAIVSLVVFFAVGGWLLSRVDVEAGRKAARDAEEARLA